MTRRMIIGSVAVGLAAGAVLLAVFSRRAPAPAPAPPNAFEEVGPVVHAFGRPGGTGKAGATPAVPRKRPAEALEAALAAVATGHRQELSSYFANERAADLFYRQWQGQLPTGSVRVAKADDFDAGAENGHVVPVTIWMTGAGGVAGLEGEAGFVTAASGVRLRHLRLEALPLKVPTWAEATRLVPAETAGTAPPQKLEAPFYGIFHLMADKRQYAVDALTGKVEQE